MTTTVRFGFSDDQRLFQDAVRDLLAKECTAAHVREAWSSPEVSSRLWKALAAMGVVGLTVPAEHGGMGLGMRDAVLVLEEAGRAAAPVPLVESIVAVAALKAGTDSTWLSRIASGDALVTIGLGRSPLVLDADVAALVLLQDGDDLHAVEPDGPDLTLQRSVDGSRRLFTVAWTPSASTVVEGSDPSAAADVGALGAAAQLVGLAGHLLDVSVEYAKTRKQFGVPIGSFQAVKHHLADVALAIDFARPLVYRAAASLDATDVDGGLHVSMAKAAASDAATRTARVALQVHGAIGYAFEHDLHLWMKRVWALAAAWGDAAAHRRRVGDQLFA